MPRTLLEALQRHLDAAVRMPDGVAPPVAILWTDPDSQWLPVIEPLRKLMPHVYALGDYAPEYRRGPAIWLKCVVDRVLPELELPAEGVTPVLYLSNVARAALRSAEDCELALQPLIELCYRGQMWHQRNARDWTVEAFLEAVLGFDLAGDQATRTALHRMLPRVAIEPRETFQGRRVDAELLLHLDVEDPVGDLLAWMSDADGFRRHRDANRWQSFRQLCQKTYGFDPEADGVTVAGEKLVNDTGGAWTAVWRRFCASPRLYPGLSKVLRMSYRDLFTGAERNPRLNEESESRLRSGLQAVADLPHQDACDRVIALEAEHAGRRNTPWADLGESPLALALKPIAILARLARSALGGATAAALADAYAGGGWKCDRAALVAVTVALAHKPQAPLLCRVVRTLYLPWLDQSARHLQDVLARAAQPPSSMAKPVLAEPGVCFLFVDGLRYDLGAGLAERLDALKFPCELKHRFAPLPTVTATAKPLAMPVGSAVGPGGAPEDFCPYLANSSSPAGVAKLRQVLEQRGGTIIDPLNPHGPAAPDQIGWCETGRLDELGHKLEIGLARQVEEEVADLAGVIEGLLAVGWRRIRVVTDHGWLLLPGGLPKVELPKSVTDARWARCAAIRQGASPDATPFPWHWDQHVLIAMPPGVGSYLASAEYAHGGISPQECVIPDLTVSAGAAPVSATIKQISWRGLRMRVVVETGAPGLRVDLRQNRNQPASSLAASTKEIGSNGEASLVVEDDANEGAAAVVVIVDADGTVIAAQATTVGDGG